ncbi:asialoglycoprotein receptor 2-like isoform X1 [Crassostrea angulata]|uniref:asialoglycoprotein receptor 2-like isoform X1 n=1 Tax=Magallana angulata TaxID=2784310 RepID=UPI0022B1BAAF|nr:asialoglycoprotein receptor 2-like isoform X1 [Crassostrea angulata]
MQMISAEGDIQGIYLHKVSSNEAVQAETTPCFIKSVHASSRLGCAHSCINHFPECAAVYYNKVMKLCKLLRCRPTDRLENQNLVGIPSGWELLEDNKACEEDWILFAGHCYHFIATGTIWNNAVSDCNSRGGSLIELHSQEEVDWVKDSFLLPETGVEALCPHPRDCPIWIGASFQHGSSTFVYNSGKAMVYPKWAFKQPSNFGGDQFCVSLQRSGKGNDRACYGVYQYLCKKDK